MRSSERVISMLMLTTLNLTSDHFPFIQFARAGQWSLYLYFVGYISIHFIAGLDDCPSFKLLVYVLLQLGFKSKFLFSIKIN